MNKFVTWGIAVVIVMAAILGLFWLIGGDPVRQESCCSSSRLKSADPDKIWQSGSREPS
jgi:hypothetical protein